MTAYCYHCGRMPAKVLFENFRLCGVCYHQMLVYWRAYEWVTQAYAERVEGKARCGMVALRLESVVSARAPASLVPMQTSATGRTLS